MEFNHKKAAKPQTQTKEITKKDKDREMKCPATSRPRWARSMSDASSSSSSRNTGMDQIEEDKQMQHPVPIRAISLDEREILHRRLEASVTSDEFLHRNSGRPQGRGSHNYQPDGPPSLLARERRMEKPYDKFRVKQYKYNPCSEDDDDLPEYARIDEGPAGIVTSKLPYNNFHGGRRPRRK